MMVRTAGHARRAGASERLLAGHVCTRCMAPPVQRLRLGCMDQGLPTNPAALGLKTDLFSPQDAPPRGTTACCCPSPAKGKALPCHLRRSPCFSRIAASRTLSERLYRPLWASRPGPEQRTMQTLLAQLSLSFFRHHPVPGHPILHCDNLLCSAFLDSICPNSQGPHLDPRCQPLRFFAWPP